MKIGNRLPVEWPVPRDGEIHVYLRRDAPGFFVVLRILFGRDTEVWLAWGPDEPSSLESKLM